ncbi:putative RNA-directed DNA polymerase [Helianthus anomalus]
MVNGTKNLEEEELWVWTECKKSLQEIELYRSRDLKQKSRVKWASLGDENTSFFHSVVNGRKARNTIPGLEIRDEWISKPALIKREVLSFFRSHFKEEVKQRLIIVCDGLRRINDQDGISLTAMFSKQEIKEAVFDCGSNKAPGPDGFNFRFVKRFWNLLEEDFYRIMVEFHDTGIINSGCSSAFITLIPKVKSPMGLKDYRPITLIGVISKVISKILANRLKKVLGKLISDSQSAFLADRYILDGPLVVNEVLEWLKRRKKKAFLLKIDFEKAYDNVNWAFLLSILSQMGFPSMWRTWIKGILESAQASVLVNGSPTFQFNSEKGLRQGDPISPFLFLIVMECLSWMLERAKSIGELKGINFLVDDMDINHLFFADDALIMGEWSRDNLQSTARILRVFYLCSGLRINLHKSNLFGVGTEDMEVDSMMEVLGCKRGAFPFVYLGIKVGAKMSRIANWNEVVEVIKNRLASWKAKNLSIGGRLILLKSVLENLPIYYLSLYKAPKAVIESMEAIMRRFLWAGCNEEKKINWVAWDIITTPKKAGGLGISKLQDVNGALLLKWVWRFKNGGSYLWKKVMMGCHGSGRTWSLLPCTSSASGCWKQIVKIGEKKIWNGNTLYSYFVGVMGDGSTINFWVDSWLREEPLRLTYPLLFRLEKNKWATVSSRLRVTDGLKSLQWEWRHAPSSTEEVSEFFNLISDIYDYDWKGGKDQWKWKGNANGIYSVKEAKKLIANGPHPVVDVKMKWKGWVPLKIKIMVWRAMLNRLPTKMELLKRGLSLPAVLCNLCDSEMETSIHLFTGCFVSAEIWSRIERWCRLPPLIVFDVPDVVKIADLHATTRQSKYILRGIIFTTM